MCRFWEASEREWQVSDNGTLHRKYFSVSQGAASDTPQPHAVLPSRRVHGPSQECASRLKLSEQGPAEGHNLPSSLSIQHSPRLFLHDTDILGSRPCVWEKVPRVDLFPMVPVGVGLGPRVVTSHLVWQQLPACWVAGGLSQEGNNHDRRVSRHLRMPRPSTSHGLGPGGWPCLSRCFTLRGEER